MGQAIAEQLKIDYEIFVFDKDENKLRLAPSFNKPGDCVELVKKVDVVILAVKPQDIIEALNGIKGNLKNKLIISIAAGITTEYIEKILGPQELIRVMPNMPAKIGAAMTCLCPGKYASDDDLDFAENLFDYLGETLRIEESMMNAVTAVSGSGPAYVCEFMERNSIRPENFPEEKKELFLNDFKSSALSIGFEPKEAERITSVTFYGTLNFLKRANISPADLEKQVASKGGTTEAALEVLKKGGTLEEAVKAALKRAKQLSGEDK